LKAPMTSVPSQVDANFDILITKLPPVIFYVYYLLD